MGTLYVERRSKRQPIVAFSKTKAWIRALTNNSGGWYRLQHEQILLPFASFDKADSHQLIVMSPVWAGTHATEVKNNVEDYVFFLDKDEVPYGCFSNAYREKNGGHAGLRESIEGCDSPPKFWCVNQELHYRKAVIFGDDETANLILAETEDAGKIKHLGRMVKGYDDAKWTELRYDVAKDAIHGKFSSDEELKKILLDTKEKIIVEAATDDVWGIGCVEFSSEEKKGAKITETRLWAVEPKEWKGENLLGRCLMDVRTKLRES